VEEVSLWWFLLKSWIMIFLTDVIDSLSGSVGVRFMRKDHHQTRVLTCEQSGAPRDGNGDM
jgi:hypothetical protein